MARRTKSASEVVAPAAVRAWYAALPEGVTVPDGVKVPAAKARGRISQAALTFYSEQTGNTVLSPVQVVVATESQPAE